MIDMETNAARNHRARRAALIAPLILVNTAAVYGQGGWAWDHLVPAAAKSASTLAAVALCMLFAAAVESIGVYLAAEAHAALMAGDASARLRLSSYAVGGLVGSLNYAHFAGPAYRPNPLAVTFGLLSAISPWLWSIHSRSLNRDRLRDLGQIDPRAVRFSPLRWVLFPVRTWRAFRYAVWAGIVSPVEAVRAADACRADGRGPVTAVVVEAVSGDVDVAGQSAIGDGHGHVSDGLDPWSYATPIGDLAASEPDTVPATEADSEPDTAPDKKPTTNRTRRTPPRRTTDRTSKADTTAARVAKLRAKEHDITQAEVARRLKISIRTVSRHWADTAPATKDDTEADPKPVNGHAVDLVTTTSRED